MSSHTTLTPAKSSAEMLRAHRQLFGIYYPDVDHRPEFPIEKLQRASTFITSQREVLRRLRQCPCTVQLNNDHPVLRVLSFEDDRTFRRSATAFRQEFSLFSGYIRQLNRLCSSVKMPHGDFLCYQDEVFKKKDKVLEPPYRTWSLGDYVSVSPSAELLYVPVFIEKDSARLTDVFLKSSVIEASFGDLLSSFAEFGKLSVLVKGNLTHRVLQMSQIQEEAEDLNAMKNIQSVWPMISYLVPILVAYAKVMNTVRYAIVSNRNWKLPK